MTDAVDRRPLRSDRLRNLIEAVPVATLVIADGLLAGGNSAAEILYGHVLSDILGQPFVDVLFDPDDRTAMVAAMTGALAHGDGVSRDRRVRRADGALLVSSFRLQRLDDRHLAWIATDPVDQGLAEQERAVLLSAEHAALARAEQAQRRLSILANASSVMTTTLDLDELLDRLSTVLVPTVADWCTIQLFDERGRVTHVSVGHRDRERAEQVSATLLAHPFDRDGDTPTAQVVRTGRPFLFTDAASMAAQARSASRHPEQSALFSSIDLAAGLVVPMQARGRVRGVLALSTSERQLGEDDVELAAEIAHRAALALGNVEAYAQERQLAETLQRALLPSIEMVSGLTIAVRYLAATDGAEVGGDWYDVIPLGPGRVDLVIGDVVGHDVEAASAMSQLRNSLRAYACADDATPARTLGLLDRLMVRLDLAAATCIVASINADDGTFTWSNAGHPPAMLLRDGVATMLDEAHDAMLGVGLASLPRRETVATLPPGASLVLYTDGAVERRHEDLDVGLRRLCSAIEAAAAGSAEDISQSIVDSLLPTGTARPDDVAILVVQRTGTALGAGIGHPCPA